MSFEIDPPPLLAPLQRVMLRDSLAEPDGGHHVEQVEILFASGPVSGCVAAAWEETVASTEALRVAFVTADGNAAGREFVTLRNFLNQHEPLPSSWESWREADRRRPLLVPHEAPWRAVYWPEEGRFIWTFHHALLDGRSLARVLHNFFERLAGGNPPPLAIAEWPAPTAEALAMAERTFRDGAVDPLEMSFPDVAAGPAVRCLGHDFALHLESLAAAFEVTAATILIWAWGQALMEFSGADAVIVEQLRAGAPQPGTAGFTMNTLPVTVRRAGADVAGSLREFRARLLALRDIESVAPEDFAPGVFPDTNGLSSSVIMVERGTPRHLVGRDFVESLVLHEATGETLMATAHVLPDFRLEVEGRGRHDLLRGWVCVLERL
jgi:hypothetical protein